MWSCLLVSRLLWHLLYTLGININPALLRSPQAEYWESLFVCFVVFHKWHKKHLTQSSFMVDFLYVTSITLLTCFKVRGFDLQPPPPLRPGCGGFHLSLTTTTAFDLQTCGSTNPCNFIQKYAKFQNFKIYLKKLTIMISPNQIKANSVIAPYICKVLRISNSY